MKFRVVASLLFAAVIMVAEASAAIVSGTVCDTSGLPLANVPVSDGKDVVITGNDGRYELVTDKFNGYVFVTTPAGYVPSKMQGNRPQFWHQLTSQKRKDETANFVLRPVNDSAYVMLAFADIQLAKHFNDVEHFNSTLLPDINTTISEYKAKGLDVFAITLGDESFDKFWYRNGYALPESCADMEKINCPIYNVIGNHDHDPYEAGDHKASRAWRRIMGPNYYSFNRGAVHYVVLDDVYYINSGASLGNVGKRNNVPLITPEQLQWLEKDLALVEDPSTPIVVAMHIPLLYQSEVNEKQPGYRLKNASELIPLLSRFDNVQVLTGHTHRNQAANADNGKIKEITYGGVCGATWRLNEQCTGSNVSMCTDGSPAGYGVWEINGRDMQGCYKSNCKDRDYQFRAYDLNTVLIPNEKYAGEYSRRNRNNEILVNVFGYAPGWTVEITEQGSPLKVSQVYCQDPLYLMINGIPQMEEGVKGYKFPKPVSHMFKATASAADSPVTVRVTDAAGRVYTQTVERPKRFHKDMQ